MQVPKIVKVMVNVGVGKFKDDKKKIEQIGFHKFGWSIKVYV